MAYNKSGPVKEGFAMAEDQVERLESRYSHMDVFKGVQVAKANFGDKSKKVPPGMYLHAIGEIPNFEKMPNSRSYDSEIVEQCLEKAKLYQNEAKLRAKREEFAVIEDDFGPALEKMLKEGKTPSYQNLYDSCNNYDKEHIMTHKKKSDGTYKYFTKKGVSEEDAKAYALAIAFYTGDFSAPVSMEANVFARRLVTAKDMYTEDGKIDSNAALIMYYLIKGLSHIDFYWGVVTRYVKLDEKDLKDYKPGEIVTWLQFSSADKGGQDMAHFKDRNTVFKIFSLTGRSIKYFSNCGQQEDEILFLPHSSFLVCHREEDKPNRKENIYLRQIELGLSKYVVMWVDDNIFDETWGNKQLMEKASTLGTHVNVHFIPKSNTKSALIFLRSEFGQRIKERDTFRIVTDMKRTNESSPSTAGVDLLLEVRNLGFNQSCLIFTGHEESANEKLKKVFGSNRPKGIKVTQYDAELEKFVLFKRG